MKKLSFFFFLVFFMLSLQSQNYINDNNLKDYRKNLDNIEKLMQNGIMKEDVSGLEYFTGYEYKTLYDWDQYFEAIVQIYMGWPSDYIKNGVIIFNLNIKIHSK